MKQTLKFKFLFCIATLIVCTMGVATVAVYITSRRTIHEAIQERLFQIVNSTSGQLAFWVHDRQQDISGWSSQQQYLTAMEDSYLGRAARIAASQKLNGHKANYQYYESLNLANIQGEILVSSDQSVIENLNICGQPFFEESLKGNPCLTSVIKSPVTQNNVFIISVPVLKNNAVEGVFFGIIDIESFAQLFMSSIKIGKTGYAYIIGPDGKAIVHPDKQFIFNVAVTDYDWGKTMMSKENEFFTYSWKGAREIGFFKKDKMTNWIVAAAVSVDEIFVPLHNLQLINLVITVFFIAIAILSTTILYKRFIQIPMNLLMIGIARFGRGELKEKIQFQARDEFRLLAETINTMADNLSRTTSSIDKLNMEIDERKKAKEKLQQLLSLHEATLEATADGIMVINLNGKIVTYNRKFLEMWRIPADLAVTGDNAKLLAFVSNQMKDPQGFIAEAQRFYTQPEDDAYDLLEFKDGRVFERFSRPQKIHGKIVGYVRSFHDITNRIKAETEIKCANTRLEQINKELLGTQSQLMQSEKLASIGQLAAGVAHEMNNPIGFVASNFETLENYMAKFKKLISLYQELDEEVQKSTAMDLITKGQTIENTRKELKIDFILEDIHSLFDESKEGLSRVTKIIQSLRDFSRIDQVTDICEFDLNDGIRDTLTVAKNEIKYDCDIMTEFAELPPILCNPGQINQVILNIVVNAAQAIKAEKREEKGNIAIKTYRVDDFVLCEIADNGPGIPEEIITKVFDPFFTTKPVGKGTGLGLSISRDIIVKHKGQLKVDSTIGKGTKFTIKLPIQFELPASNLEAVEDETIGNIT
jgi:PAS domain S-box-containing protein